MTTEQPIFAVEKGFYDPGIYAYGKFDVRKKSYGQYTYNGEEIRDAYVMVMAKKSTDKKGNVIYVPENKG